MHYVLKIKLQTTQLCPSGQIAIFYFTFSFNFNCLFNILQRWTPYWKSSCLTHNLARFKEHFLEEIYQRCKTANTKHGGTSEKKQLLVIGWFHSKGILFVPMEVFIAKLSSLTWKLSEILCWGLNYHEGLLCLYVHPFDGATKSLFCAK